MVPVTAVNSPSLTCKSLIEGIALLKVITESAKNRLVAIHANRRRILCLMTEKRKSMVASTKNTKEIEPIYRMYMVSVSNIMPKPMPIKIILSNAAAEATTMGGTFAEPMAIELLSVKGLPTASTTCVRVKKMKYRNMNTEVASAISSPMITSAAPIFPLAGALAGMMEL